MHVPARPQHEKLFVASLLLALKGIVLLLIGMKPKNKSNPKEMFQVTQSFELWRCFNEALFLFAK